MPGLALIKTDRAATICQRFDLRCGAEKLLAPGHTPAQFLELLIDNAYYSNAVRFLAHGLPGHEGIWWGCLCLRVARPERMTDGEEQALEAAVRWVVKPTPEHRAQAEVRVAATLDTPAGKLARAVAACVDGRSPAGGPGAMHCRLIAAAVQSASELKGADLSSQYALKFLAIGTDVANGKHRWS